VRRTLPPEFLYLYGRYRDELPKWLQRLGCPDADRPDAIQEALTACWEHPEAILLHPKGERAGMIGIAYNIARRLRRKTSRLDFGFREEAYVEPDAPPLELLLDACERINALPIPLRTAVLLVDIEQYSYKEAAVRMRATYDAVVNWVHRGRAKLRRPDDDGEHGALMLVIGEPAIRAGLAAYVEAAGLSRVGSGEPFVSPPRLARPRGALVALCAACIALGFAADTAHLGHGEPVRATPEPIACSSSSSSTPPTTYAPGHVVTKGLAEASAPSSAARIAALPTSAPRTEPRPASRALGELPEPMEPRVGQTWNSRARSAAP